MNTARQVTRQIDEDDLPFDLLKRRRRLGLSQIQLGEALGIDPTLISKWERGTRAIPYGRLVHVALCAIEMLPKSEREKL